ncbi:MAG: hypothetical protein JSU70_12080 [Phycisphaerales bacterium]|nr:MAG: hypothetical protein JSU70_12080 [Phycisphaerales bacterium]
MKKLILLLSALALILALVSAGMAEAEKPEPKLEGITEYDLVAPPFGPLLIDGEGRVLVWEGTISGDIDGVIQWWIGPTTGTGSVVHYDDRCVILDEDGNMLLEVLESGSTTYRDGMDPIWRTNGAVVDASGDYTAWIGRQTHADGDADMQASPPCGTGTFRVN